MNIKKTHSSFTYSCIQLFFLFVVVKAGVDGDGQKEP